MGIVEAFSQANIDDFLSYLLNDREVAGSTVNRYKSAISVMMTRVLKKLPEVPTFPKFKESRGRFRFFSHDEETAISGLWQIWEKHDERAFLLFLIDTGARTYTEGTTLKWEDIHKDRAIFWETKNGSFRAVPLSNRVQDILKDLKKRKGNQPGPFTHLEKDYMRRLWDRTRAALPQIEDAVLYCTRHTYGSRMVMNGVPLSVLKKLMGHSDIKMTERYAVFEDGAAFSAALAALNSACGGGSQQRGLRAPACGGRGQLENGVVDGIHCAPRPSDNSGDKAVRIVPIGDKARVVELADTSGLGPDFLTELGVQVPPRAPQVTIAGDLGSDGNCMRVCLIR
jgi:hypothetical protein